MTVVFLVFVIMCRLFCGVVVNDLFFFSEMVSFKVYSPKCSRNYLKRIKYFFQSVVSKGLIPVMGRRFDRIAVDISLTNMGF